MASEDFDHLTTEATHPDASQLDRLSAIEIVELMNREDQTIALAVGREGAAIARAIDAIVERLDRGGRLLYVGAGTSGRLGVLDASECPPTFRSPAGQIVGIIAGGETALTSAIEGAEDDPDAGRDDLIAHEVGTDDVVVGIASSGRTPYVLGALAVARERGACTVALACNADSPLAAAADIAITVVVGPEIVAGSTRLKSGTATKMVLNMLTTGAMVRRGKVYGNRMVDLAATNAKLRSRAQRIVRECTGLDEGAANRLLADCDGEVKTALVSHGAQITAAQARARLAAASGRVRDALEDGADR